MIDDRLPGRDPSRRPRLALPGAIACLATAMVVLVGNLKSAETLALGLVAAAALGVLVEVVTTWRSVRLAVFHRSTLYGLNSAFQVVLVLAIVAMVDFVAWRQSERAWWMPKWDLTEEGLHTLSPQSVEVLARLDRRSEPVKVTGFFLDPRGSSRQERQLAEQRFLVRDLLERYARRTDKFQYRMIDPEKDPITTREYNPGVNGVLVFETREQKLEVNVSDIMVGNPAMGQKRKFKGEQVVTSKLLDLLEGVRRKIYFTVGHQEGDLGSDQRDGYSALKQQLELQGFRTEKANLLVLGEVPDDATVLVVLGPKREFAPSEIEAIRRRLEARRPVIVLLDSRPYVKSVADLLSDYGTAIRENLFLEPDPERRYPGNPTMAIPFLNGHHITDPLIERDLQVMFREGLGLDHSRSAQVRYDVRTIVQGSGTAWGETNLSNPRPVLGPEDLQPPVSLAFAISSRAGSNDGREQRPKDELRLVVFGDSDFVANDLLQGVAGNADLFLNALAWSTRDEDRITVRPKEYLDRKANLPEEASSRILLGLTLALPGLVLAIGFSIWWTRRTA